MNTLQLRNKCCLHIKDHKEMKMLAACRLQLISVFFFSNANDASDYCIQVKIYVYFFDQSMYIKKLRVCHLAAEIVQHDQTVQQFLI